jgi:Domain of unknown function (DUF4440)
MATPDLDSLLLAERALQSAQLASDVDALDQLLHPQLRFIGPDSNVHGKEDDLESHRGGNFNFLASEEKELDAHVYGSAAVTLALLALEVEINDEPVSGNYRYTRTWVWQDQRWQIVAGAVALAVNLPPPA